MLLTVFQRLGQPPVLTINGLATSTFALITFIEDVYIPVITASALTAGFLASVLGIISAILKLIDRFKNRRHDG